MMSSSGAKVEIPGVNDLFTLMAFLQDKKTVTKYLKELGDKTKALEKERKVVGTLKQIEDLREQAEKEAKKAKDIVENAEGMGNAIVMKADREAIVQQGFMDKKSRALKNRETKVKEGENALLHKQSEFAGYSEEIATRLANAKRLEREAEKAKSEYETKRAAMKRLVA